jgi:hypothetical protein
MDVARALGDGAAQHVVDRPDGRRVLEQLALEIEILVAKRPAALQLAEQRAHVVARGERGLDRASGETIRHA